MFKDVFSYRQTIPECRQWYRTECDKEITQIMYITLFRYQAGLAEYRPHHKGKTFVRPFNVFNAKSYISMLRQTLEPQTKFYNSNSNQDQV